MSILGMTREHVCWDTPIVTMQRLQAAYVQRHGQDVEWDAGRTERLIEALEKHNAGKDITPSGPEV